MPLDLPSQLGAVTRSVDTRDHDGRPARVIRASRTYPTAIDDLWDAITSAERIPRWFMPVSGDLRLGGRFQLQGNAGGEILTCEPPRHLAVTWEFGGQVSWVDVHLFDEGAERARLELEHVAHVPDEMWDKFGPGAVGVGWEMGLLGLDQHLATTASVSPDTAAEWMASDEGREFARRSSEGWGRASALSGTDEAAAAAAAERTTAFYTGESAPGESAPGESDRA